MLGKKIPGGDGGGPGTTGRSLLVAAFKASIQLLPNLKELQLLQYLAGLCKIQHVLGAGCVGFPERGTAGLGHREDVRAEGRGWSCCPGRHGQTPLLASFLQVDPAFYPRSGQMLQAIGCLLPTGRSPISSSNRIEETELPSPGNKWGWLCS